MLAECRKNLLIAHQAGVCVGVGEDGAQSVAGDGKHRCYKGVCRHHHFVAIVQKSHLTIGIENEP